MKAIGLIRVSTEVQDLNQQTEVVRSEMIKDGYRDPEDIIMIADKESAVKLSEEERQGLNRMKTEIENDSSINRVYVFELSRLSRRPEVLYSIRDWLINHKIQLIVIKPYMRLLEDDGSISQTGSIMFGIFGAMAEQEGYLRKERTSRGKRKAQAEGKSLGNWLPLGYTRDSENHIIIDEEKAELVRKIFRMCVDENKSSIVIARELDQTGEYPISKRVDSASSSILNILHDTAYIGICRFNKRRQKQGQNRYPRIISDEMFYKAEELLTARRTKDKTSHKNVYWCKGLIRDKNTRCLLTSYSAVASYSAFSDRDDKVKHSTMCVPMNLMDSFAWHLTKQFIANNDTTKVKQLKKELLEKIDIATKKVKNNLAVKKQLENKEIRIQERIIDGKLSEALGDKMLEEIYELQASANENQNKFESEYQSLIEQKMKYDRGISAVESVETMTDPNDISRLIHDSIKGIEIEKGGEFMEGNKYRPAGYYKANKYGIMTVTFDDESVQQYRFNSYTKRVFTMDGELVPYTYLERFVHCQKRNPKHKRTIVTDK